MFKKTSSVVTLLAFLLFEGACVIHRVEDIPVKSAAAKDEIVGVVKTSGEYIQLSKDAPGRIEGDRLFLRTTPSAPSKWSTSSRSSKTRRAWSMR